MHSLLESAGMLDFLQKYAKEKDAWMTNIKDFENRSQDYDVEVADVIRGYEK